MMVVTCINQTVTDRIRKAFRRDQHSIYTSIQFTAWLLHGLFHSFIEFVWSWYSRPLGQETFLLSLLHICTCKKLFLSQKDLEYTCRHVRLIASSMGHFCTQTFLPFFLGIGVLNISQGEGRNCVMTGLSFLFHKYNRLLNILWRARFTLS